MILHQNICEFVLKFFLLHFFRLNTEALFTLWLCWVIFVFFSGCVCDDRGTQVSTDNGDWCWLDQFPCILKNGDTTNEDWEWVRCENDGNVQIDCPILSILFFEIQNSMIFCCVMQYIIPHTIFLCWYHLSSENIIKGTGPSFFILLSKCNDLLNTVIFLMWWKHC